MALHPVHLAAPPTPGNLDWSAVHQMRIPAESALRPRPLKAHLASSSPFISEVCDLARRLGPEAQRHALTLLRRLAAAEPEAAASPDVPAPSPRTRASYKAAPRL